MHSFIRHIKRQMVLRSPDHPQHGGTGAPGVLVLLFVFWKLGFPHRVPSPLYHQNLWTYMYASLLKLWFFILPLRPGLCEEVFWRLLLRTFLTIKRNLQDLTLVSSAAACLGTSALRTPLSPEQAGALVGASQHQSPLLCSVLESMCFLPFHFRKAHGGQIEHLMSWCLTVSLAPKLHFWTLLFLQSKECGLDPCVWWLIGRTRVRRLRDNVKL